MGVDIHGDDVNKNSPCVNFWTSSLLNVALEEINTTMQGHGDTGSLLYL